MAQATYTFDQLKNMTVAQLRDIAKDVQHDAVQGYTTMHKDHLLPALCTALGIPGHAAHVAHGEKKTKIKKQIHELKKQRDEAVKAKDYKKLAATRDLIHTLKHQLRRMAS